MNLDETNEINLKFSNFLVKNGISPLSLKFYKSDLNHFLQNINLISEINSKLLNLYITNSLKNSSIKTTNRRLSTIRKFSQFLIDNGLSSFDFSKDIKNIIPANTEAKYLSEKIATFDSFLINQKVSKNTRRNYLSDINKFITWQKKTDGGVKDYINQFYLNNNRASYNRMVSALKKYYEFKKENFPISKFQFPKSSAYGFIQENIIKKLENKPTLQSLIYNIFYSRPKWYKRYHTYPVASYFHFAILVIFSALSGYLIYDRVFKGVLAYPTTPVTPNRYLSFQGRLTNNLGTPITTAKDLIFKLYTVSSGGTAVWDSTTCSITPDSDGIFSTLLGSSCGGAIASSVFSENASIWLGVQVAADAEATPRIQIATVAYTLNSETLQGFPLGTGVSTVPYIDSTGKVAIAAASPTIQSTSGTFGITGQAMTISTADTSNGSIAINPDGTGTLNLTFEGVAPGGGVNGFINATNANITSGALYGGKVASAATGYNFIDFQSGVSPTSKFSVNDAGNVTMAGDITISGGNINTGNIALVIGDGTTDSIQLQTDGTGNGEILLPNDVIGPNEIFATGQTDEYCITYEATGTTWEWQACGGASYWTQSGNNLYPSTLLNLTGIGTVSPISRLSVVNNPGAGNYTGKAAFLVDQYENQDILTASASGTTKMTLANDGTLKLYNATSTISNTSGDITIDSASNIIGFSGDTATNIGVLQVAGATAVAYSRFGSDATGHGGAITAGSDLLVSGDLELNGNLYLDSGTIANAAGTAAVLLSSSVVDTASTLSSSNWFIENTANVGQAALMVNQTKSGDLFTASASGTPKFTITNGGSVNLVDDAYIGLGAAAARLVFDATPTPDEIDVLSATLDLNTNLITNIGDTGSDFTSGGGLTLAGTFDANGQLDLGDGGDLITLSGSDFNIAVIDNSTVNLDGDGSPTADLFQIGNGDTSATMGVDALNITFSASNAIGDLIHLTPAYAGGVTNSLTFNVVDIDAFSPTNASGIDNVNGIFIGDMTDPGATIWSHALDIGSGWDMDINATTSLDFGVDGTAETKLTPTAFSPSTTDSNALGTSSLFWSDLFLASGGVINYNSDVTLTHSTDTLAMAGGDFTITFDNATNNDIDNLLTLTHTTSGTPTAASKNFTVDQANSLGNKLVAYWKMEETNTTRVDSAGANDLTDVNTVPNIAGKVNNAADFERDNSEYIYAYPRPDLSITHESYTIAGWYYLESKPVGGYMVLASRYGSNAADKIQFDLYYQQSDDRFHFAAYRQSDASALGNVAASTFGAPSLSTYYFVKAWYDADAHTLNLSVNNGAADSAVLTTNPGEIADTSDAYFMIGADTNGTAGFWDGRIDEVGVWKRKLTTQETTDLYNGGSANTCTDDCNSPTTTTTGIGSGILYRAEDASGNTEDQARISSIFNTATNGTETSSLLFETRVAGAALTRSMRLDGAGNLTIAGSLMQSGSPDIAENIKVTDSSIEAGDIVMIDESFQNPDVTDIYNKGAVKKANQKYSNSMIGVISSDPGILINSPKSAMDTETVSDEDERPLVLAGRVPVKVSTVNGNILAGDAITSSDILGVGVKATDAGKVIGYALEGLNCSDEQQPCLGKILVQVNLSWFDPNYYLTDTGDIKIIKEFEIAKTVVDDSLVQVQNSIFRLAQIALNGTRNLIDRIGTFGQVFTAQLTAGRGSFNEVETNLLSPVANSDLIIDLQPNNATESSKLAIIGKDDSEVASIDGNGNANFEGNVTSEELIVDGDATVSGTLYVNDIESKRLQDIENLLKIVEENQTLLAEATTWSTDNSTDLANSLNSEDWTVNNLFVTKQAAITSLLVTDNFTVNTIDSLDKPLSIQSLALNPLEIMAGKIKVETNGDVAFLANVEVAGNLTINNLVVANNTEEITSSSTEIISGETKSNSTAGKAVLVAGTDKLRIINNKVGLQTLVYLTPLTSTKNQVLYVKAKDTGYFEAGFDQVLDTDVEFNWWIIELQGTKDTNLITREEIIN